jgi:hypothetical protein
MDKSVYTFFETSPFSIVADETAAKCWSGRKKVLESLVKLRNVLMTRADSSLDLVWANLGAGKTHTLFHLEYLLSQSTDSGGAVCAFVEMPEQLRTFHDLYKRIVSAIPIRNLSEVLSTCPVDKLPDNLARAGNVLRSGGPAERELVLAWINGERPYLNDLKRCSGITQRIEDDLTATDVLCGIVQAFAFSKRRLVLCIDEFQRIGVLNTNSRNRILSSIRTAFSRNPRYLSIVLAIQSMVERSALDLIPPELKTLMGKKPSISLPEMDVREAKEFVSGRFAYFRPPGYRGTEFAPFEASAIDGVLEFLHAEAHVALIPREILQTFAYIYDEAGTDSMISRETALNIVASINEPKD